jgi:hypothetical protein
LGENPSQECYVTAWQMCQQNENKKMDFKTIKKLQTTHIKELGAGVTFELINGRMRQEWVSK